VFIRSAITALLVLLLTACASQPVSRYDFSVTSIAGERASWPLKSIATSGRIELTGHLVAEGGEAARIVLRFGGSGLDFPIAYLAFSDHACKGAYTMLLSHRVDKNNEITDYFTTKLPWDAPFKVRLLWSHDGKLTVTINNAESKTIKIYGSISSLVLEAYFGGISVDSFIYSPVRS